MTDAAAPQIVNNLARGRFELDRDGQIAHLDYAVSGDRLRLLHVEVPEAIRGHHYSDDLARAGLDYARREHLQVVPICPTVRAFIRHHPEYVPLVEAHWKDRLAE